MLRDAEYVYAAEKRESSRWLLSACRALGTANVLLGRPQEALDAFGEALALCGNRPELAHIQLYCLSYMAFAATEIGDRRARPEMGERSAQAGRGSASRRDRPERDRPRGRSAGTPAARRPLRGRPPARTRPAAPPTAPRGHVARSRPRAALRRDQPRVSATSPAPSSSSSPRMTRSRATPTPERSPPGSRASENGSAEGRTTSSPRPSSGSSLSCRPISRSRRSPIDSTSPAQPSRPRSRRSTTSSASRPGPKPSRSSTSTTSERPTAGPQAQIRLPAELASSHATARWFGQCGRCRTDRLRHSAKLTAKRRTRRSQVRSPAASVDAAGGTWSSASPPVRSGVRRCRRRTSGCRPPPTVPRRVRARRTLRRTVIITVVSSGCLRVFPPRVRSARTRSRQGREDRTIHEGDGRNPCPRPRESDSNWHDSDDR